MDADGEGPLLDSEASAATPSGRSAIWCGAKVGAAAGFVANLLIFVGLALAAAAFWEGELIVGAAILLGAGTPVSLIVGMIFGGSIGGTLRTAGAVHHAPKVAALAAAATVLWFIYITEDSWWAWTFALAFGLIGYRAGKYFANELGVEEPARGYRQIGQPFRRCQRFVGRYWRT